MFVDAVIKSRFANANTLPTSDLSVTNRVRVCVDIAGQGLRCPSSVEGGAVALESWDALPFNLSSMIFTDPYFATFMFNPDGSGLYDSEGFDPDGKPFTWLSEAVDLSTIEMQIVRTGGYISVNGFNYLQISPIEKENVYFDITPDAVLFRIEEIGFVPNGSDIIVEMSIRSKISGRVSTSTFTVTKDGGLG
jgi:hypothetical protein